MVYMNVEISQQERAEQCAERATQVGKAGAVADALAQWRMAALHYAEAWRIADESGSVPTVLTRARADACRQYGDALARQEQHADAANIFQEAADLYGQLSAPTDREYARECARKALAAIAALRNDPRSRLYLLIARYVRQQQQLALRPGTWAQQADCCLHIAQILLRRDRPEEACARYMEALELYGQAEQAEVTQDGPSQKEVQKTQYEAVALAQAECHHRLGNLLANVLIDEPDRINRALAHYNAAIVLYQSHDSHAQGKQEDLLLCVSARADLLRRLEK